MCHMRGILKRIAIIQDDVRLFSRFQRAEMFVDVQNLRSVERATIEGAGHFMHMEEPEATARVILDWLPR